MNSKLTISVIICAYTEKRWDALVKAVASIHNQSHKATQLILVIDHSESLFQKASQQFPQATVIQNKFKQGLSGARNSGILLANNDIIAFMDEDAVALPNWLETLASSYQSPDILGVGGKIQPAWVNGRPGWFPKEFDWVVGCTYLGMPEKPAPVRNLIGCNMSFRRELFTQLDGFQEGMGRIGTKPVGCEETEFCIRVHQKWPEATLLYQPKAAVLHRVPLARASWHYFRSRCYSEGISKAQVAVHRGQKDALSNERTYTLKTLPLGVARGVSQYFQTRKPVNLARAAVINLGLVYTAIGYAVGRFSMGSSQKI